MSVVSSIYQLQTAPNRSSHYILKVKLVTKKPVRITSAPMTTPLKITMPGPAPYKFDKMVPWNYGGEIYYHGVKQIEQTIEKESSEEDNPEICNIVGTSKVTRSGRIFQRFPLQRQFLDPQLLLRLSLHR